MSCVSIELALTFALLGLAFGSFGNVLLLRFASGESITGRSHCVHCGRSLAWFDLIPVVSFTLLQGTCRYCKKPISWQYPLVEAVSAILFVAALAAFPYDMLAALALALLLWGLLLIVLFDAWYQLIPDLFTLIVFAAACGLTFLHGDILASAIGCVIALSWFGLQWIVSRGRIVGSGDILLGASLGLWLGWKETIVMLFLSYILGAVIGVYLIASGKATRKSRIAFGPLLALGAVIATLGIGDWYFDLIFPGI